MATVRARKAPYVSPRILPGILMRESAEGMSHESRASEIRDVRASRRYQNAIKAKFELDYIDASGSIKIENTFVHSVYRIARSSLKADDKRLMINTYVQQERSSGRELEEAEREFVGLARSFVNEVQEAKEVKQRDAKLLFGTHPLLRERAGEVQSTRALQFMGAAEFMETFDAMPRKPSMPAWRTPAEATGVPGRGTRPATASKNFAVVPLWIRGAGGNATGDRVSRGDIGTRQAGWYRRLIIGAAGVGVAALAFFYSPTSKSNDLLFDEQSTPEAKNISAEIYSQNREPHPGSLIYPISGQEMMGAQDQIIDGKFIYDPKLILRTD